MEKTELRKHAHPMPGWVALFPIPEPDAREHSGRTVAIELPGIGGVLVHQISMDDLEDGVRAGIVMEIGRIPVEGLDVEDVIPYSVGSTAYFPHDRGILIHEYVYLDARNVIAWEPAPE